jgi:hypothetical protein
MNLMKKISITVAIIFFVGCGWLFYQYLHIASSAEQQVAEDILWLRDNFNTSTAFSLPAHADKKHLETQLIQQSLDLENRFIRHYHSLFIKDGNRSCLESFVRYQNYQPILKKQVWLAEGKLCIN